MGISDEIAAQKGRLFLWAPVAFATGIAVYFALPFEPSHSFTFPALFLLMPATYFSWRRHFESAAWFCLHLAAFAMLFATIGFASAQIGTMRHGTAILERPTGAAIISGMVESVEDLGGKKGSRAVLTDLEIEDIPPEKTPKKVRVSFRKDEGLKAGTRIETLASLDPPSGPVAPGGYDFRRHLFFEGIGGVGFSYRAPEIMKDSSEGADFVFERLREAINRKIRSVGGPVGEGVMMALITGERGAIAEEDNDAMRASGLYHLLSISGTHVAMVAGVLFFFLRLFMAAIPWVALHWPIKKIAALAALCGAGFYVLLAGAEVPAVRALLMTGLVMIAVMLDRSPFSLRLIAFAALVVLAIAPHALIGVSFQMSFAAVAALICFYDSIRAYWMKWYARAGFVRKAALYLIGIVMTSVIAGTVTGLFSLYHFQTFSMYGVLANMFAVPLTGFVIMPAAIVALILMPLGLEAVPLQVMEWGTMWMLACAHWVGGLEGAVFRVHQWPGVTYACLAIGVTLFLLWEGWRGKGIALGFLCAGWVAAAVIPQAQILVSATGGYWGVRQDGKLYVSDLRREKFTAENWMRLSGLPDERPLPFTQEGSGIRCDSHGCRYELMGKNISFVKDDRGLREDMPWADILITAIPVRGESDNTLLGWSDFKDHGAHSLYIGADETVHIDRVYEGHTRPWE